MIMISEIFGPTVQGEGPLIGKPTVFVRTGGCDYRCRWCDTLYAVLPEHRNDWRPMDAAEILSEVKALSGGAPIPVSLSGGNPAMQQLEPLIDLGGKDGFTFALETQGSIPRDWFGKLDWLFLSPKPPSSGEDVDWGKFDQCVAAGKPARLTLKVTVFDEADYQFARLVSGRYPNFPIYLQVGNPSVMDPRPGPSEPTDGQGLHADLMARYRWLVERVSRDRWFTPTILPQLHVLAWGNDRGH